ncbi:single-stranded-DNA-specific exonuclease RecJ [Paenibacillus yonginensis]|uniref:Single-stranded-DNA-specific exonuclease RecJ n=1 Tax=Paenibacillus yonginensis TaxID=1462996 RepID=A0A1B1N230_9BACL|nr:single-stranded-DNA-specific exonuclease RecJ [Paenibacillus yonginensis]ANS75469.1 single-stranded-DNA-specific exonuclease RecJ [Paenibacillus yonginensis]
MLHAHYRWSTLKPDQQAVARLTSEMKLPEMVASLLVTRGFDTAEKAEAFLLAGAEGLHDPYSLHGMEEAVARIRQALANRERILIYGDYDADGVSSTSLMIRLMEHLQADFEWYIPHRSKEGYGLHNHALEAASQRGVTLVVTVDTGISAVQQVAFAQTLGLDVVITDHHEPPAVLPEAYALVNPKLPFCPYPFKGLAGVGVAYKLACALVEQVPSSWTQLVALGTVADLMPLTGENRILVTQGLASMKEEPLTGMTALLQVSGSTVLNSTTIGFAMAPRINASGRLEHAKEAVELLITGDPDKAAVLADRLDLLNRERQQIVDDIVQEAIKQLEENHPNGEIPSVVVVAGEGWNVGVVGIVASKLVEKYYRPTLILGIDAETGMCKGSARSIPGYDMYEALTECADLLDHFGGHPSAAGMSLHRDQLAAFSERLNAYADKVMEEEHYIPVLTADLECTLDEINVQTIELLSKLEPFGMNNGCPRFLIQGTQILECRQMGKDRRHLKITLKQNGSVVEAVAFGKGSWAGLLTEGAVMNLVAEASINEWNGSRKAQLMLMDGSVEHTQIFDYRGIKNPWHKLDELFDHWQTLPENNKGQAALVARPDSGTKLYRQLRELPVWVYDRNAGLIMESEEAAASCRPEEVTVLFIADAPETPEQLNTLIASFGAVERIYLLHSAGEESERVESPTREQFKQVYALLRKAAGQAVPESKLIGWLSGQTRLSSRMVTKTLAIFEELNFISRDRGMIRLNPAPAKRPLESSIRYNELSLLAEMEHYLLFAGISELTEWILGRMKGVS